MKNNGDLGGCYKHLHLLRSPYPWQHTRMVTLHFRISAIWEVCLSQDRPMEDPKSRFFLCFFFYILKSFPFTSNLEGSVAKRLDLWTSNRPASIHAFPGRAEDWLGLFAYSWSCHINICFIYSSFMPHVSLDSIIESFIAVGGVSLWVSSVCWDTK